MQNYGANNCQITDKNQYGFRSGRSVTDQLQLTYNYVTSRYDQSYTVDQILFDYANAFDKVHHQLLIDKHVSIGITGNLLNWIRSFLLGRTLSVSICGHRSQPRPTLSGVPQGSVLGPFLFLIFINHIADKICKYRMFVEDRPPSIPYL